MPEYARHSHQLIRPAGALAPRLRAGLRTLYLSVADRLSPRPRGNFLRCLYAHFVFDDQRESFARLLHRLRRLGEFVDTDRVVSMAAGELPIDGRYFHLSFDDGFRCTFDNALPILHELRIPVAFFVPSALVGAGWEAATEYSLRTTRQRAVMELATWQDLERALERGATIGSHTRSHARLSSLTDPEELTREIAGSKREIEARLGTPCRYISWPFGTMRDITLAALAAIGEAGYRACFSASRGSVAAGTADLMRLPRHHFEMHWPLSHISYFSKGGRESWPVAS